MAGTAVARMVESIATRPTLSITESRIGPRSDRRPTSARVIVRVVVSAMAGPTLAMRWAFPVLPLRNRCGS